MRVLVTGANGFLGRHLVSALSARGHTIRALVRPSCEIEHLNWGETVEVARADLASDPMLRVHLEQVDAVIHLAAAMSGSDASRFRETVTITKQLIEAMHSAGVKRLILCSSFAVYDWVRAHGTVDEELPLLEGGDSERRGGYAAAKSRQERMAERAAKDFGWALTIIRPGFIWGRGNECPRGSIGRSVGPFHLVFSAGRQLPYTHVVNAADCFCAALESDGSIGQVLNLVDGHELTAWRFKGEQLRRAHESGVRIGIPYWIAWPAILAIYRIARWLRGPEVQLPFMFMPAGFAQGYRPLEFSTRRLREILGWQPTLSLEQALEHTFSPASATSSNSSASGSGRPPRA